MKHNAGSAENPVLHEKISLLHYFGMPYPLDHFTASVILQIRNSVCSHDYAGIAVIVYSLSEIILFAGLKKGLDFIGQLIQATPNDSNNSIIFQINSSLHPPAVIARIQQHLDTIAIIVSQPHIIPCMLDHCSFKLQLPNSGLLAASVAAEVQTVRRSPSSGRVSEHLEMFFLESGLSILRPISPTSISNHHSVTAAEVSKLETKIAVEQKPLPVHNARLICFVSTDPEFDEDSDPDADLDL